MNTTLPQNATTAASKSGFSFVLVTSLFFLWVFSNSLNPILIPHLKKSFTLTTTPSMDFIEEMRTKGVYVINSAVFHSGFLAGGDCFDYQLVKTGIAANDALLKWRGAFFETCTQFNMAPAEACVQFAYKGPGAKASH